MAVRSCAQCDGPLPPESRRNKVYCSKRCHNAAYRQAGRGATAEKQREYARASYARRRVQLLAEIGPRACEECGTPLPEGSRLRRRFCSRKCINAVSLRERTFQRLEAHRRRRARMASGDTRLVTDRDWQRLVARYDERCAYCRRPEPLTQDHIIPIIRGGRHAIGNLLPACQTCNSSKRSSLLIAWLNA